MSFNDEVASRIAENGSSEALQAAARAMMDASIRVQYSYNFAWLGRPIIQYPQDIVALQELVWKIRPTLIIETGIAHGGSLILSASLLAMLELVDAVEAGSSLDVMNPKRRVVGVDIDIRAHNRAAIEAHPMSNRIAMIEGSAIDPGIVDQVRELAKGHDTVLVCLDSMHTHDHVLAELKAYGPLVSKGSYCIVYDTIVEDLPEDLYGERPWAVGDNPKTAVKEFLRDSGEFEADLSIDNQLLLTVAPHGFLKRIL